MAKDLVKPTYAGTYDKQLQETYDKINNREKFNYDVNKDALYQTYRDKYVQGGKMAMRDTMGQAASLTGGYGSSYGQAVGQQQYDAYLKDLNDVIPELYDLAYKQYSDQGTALEKQYAMIGQQAADEYSKYRDSLSDYQYDQAWQLQKEQDAYSKQKDSYTKLYNLIGSTGYQPSSSELKAAGMSSAAAKALRKEYLRQTGQGGSSGGGGGGGGSSGTSKGTDNLEAQIAALEAAGKAKAAAKNILKSDKKTGGGWQIDLSTGKAYKA